MREKWKALTKRERLLFAAALVFLALAVLLRFVPGLRFSALLCLCATAVLFIFYLLEHFARRGHRAAAWCELALIAALLLGFSLFTVLETMVVRGSFADESDAPVSAVIVLGAGVNGETPSLTLRTRIDAAAAYLEEHPDVPVVLSGGQGPGEAITEAECMRRALVRRGVDESRLYPEERSTSTQENLRYSRAILEELGVDPAQRVAIVTSDFHLCRARLMWGGDTAAVPAHLPSALYFQCLTVNYFIREAFGLARPILSTEVNDEQGYSVLVLLPHGTHKICHGGDRCRA